MDTEKLEQFNLKIQSKADENTTTVDTLTFVTFNIGDEIYGVEVQKVHEIIGMVDITRVPKSKKYIKGVINLRGAVVPVLDMRTKFNMDVIDYTQYTVIIIVEVKSRHIGMIVDAVSDVAEIPVDNISGSEQYSSTISADFIKSIGRIDEQIVIIVDIDQLLEDEEEAVTAE